MHFRIPLTILIAVVFFGSLPFAAAIQFDMSFRPLFADDPAQLELTRDFQVVFGEPSGAYIAAVLEGENLLETEFLDWLETIGEKVGQLDHVIEVVSIVSAHRVAWNSDGPSIVSVSPEIAGSEGRLLSADGRATLLLARLDIPLEDLEARRPVIEGFESLLRESVPENIQLGFSGVSVVESAYTLIVLRNFLESVALTVVCLVIVVLVLFQRWSSVPVVLVGVTLATPMTLAIMHVTGHKITIMTSMVATMVLIIGVADAIHMQQAFFDARRKGLTRGQSVRDMFETMAGPCFMTTVTTAAGFLSLTTASIQAIRDFGLSVAIGVLVVYFTNQLLVPMFLDALPETDAPTSGLARSVDRILGRVTAWITPYPGWILASFLILLVLGIVALPFISLDQRFNEEVADTHPVRHYQNLVETEFGGFLGPELDIRRTDGGSLLEPELLLQLGSFRQNVLMHPEVDTVRSVLEYLPPDLSREQLHQVYDLRNDGQLGARISETVNADGTRTAMIIRIGDLGTIRSYDFVEWLNKHIDVMLGSGYRVDVVGQWWLAQNGMTHVMSDMVRSFVTAVLIIVPIMFLVLKDRTLFVASVLPNIFPMVIALAFMAVTGITVRIGTAMILAIAFGIAVDDTIHMMYRLKTETKRCGEASEAVKRTIRGTGKAIVYTTVVLTAGFVSMLANDLIAIQDMGLVAAVTIVAALVADLFLAPATYILLARKRARESQLS